MLTEEKTIDELEEEAEDGNYGSARQLYMIYKDTQPEKADYWQRVMDQIPHEDEEPEEKEEETEEAVISVPDAQTPSVSSWYEEYSSGMTARLPVRTLKERMNHGDPFAAIVLGDMFSNEKLRFYTAAEAILESGASDLSVGRILYRINIELGNIYRDMKTGSTAENNAQAFRYYTNAFELRASEEDEHRFDHLIDCYTRGIGCPADPDKARELKKKQAELLGAEAMLAMAAEYSRLSMKLEATEMLQECDEAAGENDGLYKAVARWQLARLGVPASDGTVPHETREMLNIAAFEPKRGTLDKYMSQAERNALKESAHSLMNSGSPEQKTAAELAYLCANLTQLQAPGDQKEALDDYKTAAKSGIEEARKKYLKLIQNIENQYPIQNDPQGTIMYAELLAEFYSEESDAASALKWKLNNLLAGKEYPENEMTELLKQASGYTNEKLQLDGNTCGMLQDLYYKAGMYDLSREWAGYGAEKGNAQSQYQYAVFLMESADTDPKKIFDLLRSAAEGGCRPAFAKLGDCYYEGSGTEKDLAAAEQWYVKAGTSAGDEVLWKLAGIQLDQNRLADAKRTLTSITARDSETNMLLAEISSRLVQPDETEFFLAEAANGGYVPAMIQLAEFAKEHDKPYMCAHWYQKASDEGNIAEAALHYAECRQDGYGVDCDYTDALRYYLKAAKAGLKEAYFPIAQLLESGRCGSENTSRALSYYIKAGNSGNAEAMYKVGMMCMDGIYTEQNTSIGLKWLEHAAAAGNVPALETLGEYWSSGTQPEENYNKAVSYLVSAATKGSSRAMTLLGRIYSLPIGIQNLPLARQCYEDAADTGDMDAIRALADMYSNGIGGERDSRKAASLRAKILADDGSALAENAAAKAGRLYDQAVAAGSEGINKLRETVNDFIDDDTNNNDGVSGWLKDIGRKLKG